VHEWVKENSGIDKGGIDRWSVIDEQSRSNDSERDRESTEYEREGDQHEHNNIERERESNDEQRSPYQRETESDREGGWRRLSR